MAAAMRGSSLASLARVAGFALTGLAGFFVPTFFAVRAIGAGFFFTLVFGLAFGARVFGFFFATAPTIAECVRSAETLRLRVLRPALPPRRAESWQRRFRRIRP